MSFSTFFMLLYIVVGLIIVSFQVYFIFSKKKTMKRSLLIISLGLSLFILSVNSTKIAGILHRVFLLNKPFQKDLLPLTRLNGENYVLIDIKNGELELIKVDVNKREKAIKLYKNNIIKIEGSSLVFESFETEKVELIDE